MSQEPREFSPPDPCVTKTNVPTSVTSRVAAFRYGAWRGAKRGFIGGATYPPLLVALVWFIGTLVCEPVLSYPKLVDGLGILPLGVCVYGVLGAAIGAMISGTIAARRFGHTQPPSIQGKLFGIARGDRLFFVGLAALTATTAIAGAAVAWKYSQQYHRQKTEFADSYRKTMECEIMGYYLEFGRMPNSAQELVRHSRILRTPEVFDGIVKSGFNRPTLEEGWMTYEHQVFTEVVSLCRQRIRNGNTERDLPPR